MKTIDINNDFISQRIASGFRIEPVDCKIDREILLSALNEFEQSEINLHHSNYICIFIIAILMIALIFFIKSI